MNDVQRDEQVRQWVKAAPESEALWAQEVVMWGVWFMLDDLAPPYAMFATEVDANLFAVRANRREWHVGPCVLAVVWRNSADVPERA